MDLADAAFIATQVGVTGAGIYDLYKGYKHLRGTSAPLMSGRVITPSSLKRKQGFLRGFKQSQRGGLRSRRRLNFRPPDTERPETIAPTMPATHAKSNHRRTKYAGKMNQANIGMPLGYRPSKRQVEQNEYCKRTGTLNSWAEKQIFGLPAVAGDPVGTVRPVPLIRIPYDSATERLDTRSTKYVAHRGIKLDMIIRREPGATLPITLHYAVLTDRQGSLAGPNGTVRDKFFLAQEAATDQAEDFIDAAGRFWAYQQPLNPRQNNIVLHGKVNIGISDSGAAADLQQKMLRRRQVYLKTRKQLEFPNLDANPDSDLPTENFYIVWWYYVKNSPVVGAEIATATVNVPNLVMRITNYWSKSNMYS